MSSHFEKSTRESAAELRDEAAPQLREAPWTAAACCRFAVAAACCGRGAGTDRILVTKLHLVTHFGGKLHFPWRGCLRAGLEAWDVADWQRLRSPTSRASASPSATWERGKCVPLFTRIHATNTVIFDPRSVGKRAENLVAELGVARPLARACRKRRRRVVVPHADRCAQSPLRRRPDRARGAV
jgi:hypothetical protein